MEKYKEDTEQPGNWFSWGVQKMKQLNSNRGQATEPNGRATEACPTSVPVLICPWRGGRQRLVPFILTTLRCVLIPRKQTTLPQTNKQQKRGALHPFFSTPEESIFTSKLAAHFSREARVITQVQNRTWRRLRCTGLLQKSVSSESHDLSLFYIWAILVF